MHTRRRRLLAFAAVDALDNVQERRDTSLGRDRRLRGRRAVREPCQRGRRLLALQRATRTKHGEQRRHASDLKNRGLLRAVDRERKRPQRKGACVGVTRLEQLDQLTRAAGRRDDLNACIVLAYEPPQQLRGGLSRLDR